MIQYIAVAAGLLLLTGTILSVSAQSLSSKEKREIVLSLLKSLETRDPKPFAFINPQKYIQHNLQIEDGAAGLQKLFAQLPKETKVNTVRIFVDGDYVVAHSEYEFFGPKVGIDVFRFEKDRIVEHWDNLEAVCPQPNFSGRTQLDGPTALADPEKTEANKAVVRGYFETVIFGKKAEQISNFRSMDNFHQHNCQGADNKSGGQMTKGIFAKPGVVFKIEKLHLLLGEGNFVLAVSEGVFDSKPTVFYDLYRIENNKMVEHWDVLETMLPKEQWKNTNGKF